MNNPQSQSDEAQIPSMSGSTPSCQSEGNSRKATEQLNSQELDPTRSKTMPTIDKGSSEPEDRTLINVSPQVTTSGKAVEQKTQSICDLLTTEGMSSDKLLTNSQNAWETRPSCSRNPNSSDTEEPSGTLTNAVMPLSSSLPSKLLRLQARRSAAEALLQQIDSLDSQFGSEEGAAAGGCDFTCNDCADIYDVPSPTEPPMSPPPPRSSPVDCVDGGMGSSIDDSEESEVDDELKPLAVDNHVMLHQDVDLISSGVASGVSAPSPKSADEADPAVLSEANLEKFHKHHFPHPLENIYLHPNFKYELQGKDETAAEASPPPAVAPANSPTEQPKRVHRSFLTMPKKSVLTDLEIEPANSVASNQTSVTTTEPNGDQPLINEIDTLDPALVPNDEIAAEIAEAVEYYFANDCLLKDAFLLKHVRRNKEGFVSLKLVSSFKRVRQLTKEWKVVGNALRRKSRKIELNDLGTKVRRIEPLPSFDETMPSRTIVACDLPLDKLTIEKVSDIFSKCGEIALIRILKPGMAIPVDVRQFMNKYPELQQKECALVEYLESSSAREAKSLQGTFQVYDMVAPKKKTGKKATVTVIPVTAPVTRMVENYRYYNDASYERTRGGSFSGVVPHGEGDLRFKLRRNNSDFPTRMLPEYQRHNSFGSGGVQNVTHYQPQLQQPLLSQHHPQSQTMQYPSFRSNLGNSGEHIHQHNQQYQQQQHHPHQHHQHHQNQHQHHQQQQSPYHYQPRGSIGHDSHNVGSGSPGSHMNYYPALSPRRYSNASTVAAGLNDAATQSQVACAGNHGHNNNNNILTNYNNNINNNNNNANTSTIARRLSNCSDSYSSHSEMSRRLSNCSENAAPPSAQPQQRRDSNCSENCPCARRASECGQTEVFRKTSQGSIGSGERRFSNGSLQFERSFSNVSDHNRRMSNDFNCDRKQSMETQASLSSSYADNDGNVGGGGGGYNVFRRYSNSFNNNIANKLAQYDNAHYIHGRRISSDSGYDRRCSFGSEYEGSPRSRTGSFLNSYKHGHGGEFDGSPRSRTNSFLDGASRSRSGSFALRNAENLVRTPLGPDGSKGFGSRVRKFGQTISPVN